MFLKHVCFLKKMISELIQNTAELFCNDPSWRKLESKWQRYCKDDREKLLDVSLIHNSSLWSLLKIFRKVFLAEILARDRAPLNPYGCLKKHLAASPLFDHCCGCLFLSVSYFFIFLLPMTISVLNSSCYWLMDSFSLTILYRDDDRYTLNFEKEAEVGLTSIINHSFFCIILKMKSYLLFLKCVLPYHWIKFWNLQLLLLRTFDKKKRITKISKEVWPWHHM